MRTRTMTEMHSQPKQMVDEVWRCGVLELTSHGRPVAYVVNAGAFDRHLRAAATEAGLMAVEPPPRNPLDLDYMDE